MLTASTGAGYSYQWQKNGANICGATCSVYTATASGSYTVIVTNSSKCTATSTAVTVTVNTVQVITAQPVNVCVTSGSSATFSVSVTGALSYQWQQNGVNISGATKSAYTISSVTSAMNNYIYLAIVSNGCGSVKTCPATLTVALPPTSPCSTPSVCTCNLSYNSSCNAQQYEIEYWITTSCINDIKVTSTSCCLSSLTPGTKYTWQIRTITPCGSVSGWSSACTFTTKTGSCSCRALSADNTSYDFNVYPNPATGNVNISLPPLENESTLSIYNMAGQLVHSEKVNAQAANNIIQIDMTVYSKGMYYIKFTNAVMIKTVKLVLQ